jgi:hypothetical protein
MARQDQKLDTSELNSRALALAEQLGRMAGTLEGTAESLLNRTALTDQLAQVRDGAAELLKSLTEGAGTSSAPPRPARSGVSRGARSEDPAHAPGKRHRKPSPSVRGAKKSDSRIPKMRTAAAARRRRKSYA